MEMRGFRQKMNEPCDDEGISWLHEVRSRSIYTDLLLPFAAIEDVGFEAGAACDVPHVHRLVAEEGGQLKEVPWNRDTALVVDVRVGYDGPMNLGEKKFAESSIHMDIVFTGHGEVKGRGLFLRVSDIFLNRRLDDISVGRFNRVLSTPHPPFSGFLGRSPVERLPQRVVDIA